MCTGKCAKCIGVTLYPLAAISILCNILLFFPDWSTRYMKEERVTAEVEYMGGLIGGGVMVSAEIRAAHWGWLGVDGGSMCNGWAGKVTNVPESSPSFLARSLSFSCSLSLSRF